MKCHTVQNGGFMFLIIFLWVSSVKTKDSYRTYTIQKFCSETEYIRNIEIGDSFQLVLKSDPTAPVEKWYQKSKRNCLRQFKTSDPAAHFIVDIDGMNIPSCSGCRCNYFEISVQDYKKRYCGQWSSDRFSSKSDTISIDFYHHSFTMGFDVTLTFTVERNFFIVEGTPSDPKHGGGSFLESPYFPSPLPRGYRADYLLRSDDPKSHVVLLFLDFQISNHSFVQVEGNNGTYKTRIYGSTFRPPVIVSQFNQLNVQFQSSDELVNEPGFRALISFVRTVDSLSVPYTDCGGLKHGRGGIMNIATHATFSLYDCVWLVLLPFLGNSNISISVNMKEIGHKSNLEFRNGLNSKSELVGSVNCETENCTLYSNEMAFLASMNELYVRFSGYLDVYSEVNISYSTFHTGSCSETEFSCGDGRCLLLHFQCDGVKQCPGGEDELHCSTTASPNSVVSPTSRLRPSGGQASQVHRHFFAVLLVGCFGLAAVAVAFIVIWIVRKARSPSVERRQPLIVDSSPGMLPSLYHHRSYGTDCPPSYEDFIKAADCYPPLLYTRAERCALPKDPGIAASCTTSFSCRGSRNSSESSSSGSAAEAELLPSLLSVEIFNSGGGSTQGSSSGAGASGHHPLRVQRWYSLDSKLNDLVRQDTCHLFLSIIHPVCDAHQHATRVQCHSLPSNFKISSERCAEGDVVKLREPVWLPSIHDRRCSWSFASPAATRVSELAVATKARCCSDPCKGIRIHFSE